jgi:5-methyltetrahydrofolate--homocysteine methyltransferase
MDLTQLYQFVIDGDAAEVEVAVQAALDSGISPDVILSEGLISAMDEVGRRFEEGDFFVPEMLIAARAMQAGLRLLKPHLVSSNVTSSGRIAIGTIKGDLHDIGKNLVAMMMEGAGFDVQDLGVDVSPADFVKAAQSGADIIGMSALLTTTMSNMSSVMDALKAAGVRENVRVMVGGAPVTQEFANQIGADGFATDASGAVRVARQLVKK